MMMMDHYFMQVDREQLARLSFLLATHPFLSNSQRPLQIIFDRILVVGTRDLIFISCLLCQINGKKTVGVEAFARIAPACAAVADPMTVHNLFDALTSCSGGRLHFLIYDKYLKSLYKYGILISLLNLLILLISVFIIGAYVGLCSSCFTSISFDSSKFHCLSFPI